MLILRLSFKDRRALSTLYKDGLNLKDLAMQNITIIIQWKQYTYPHGEARVHFSNGIHFKSHKSNTGK